MEGLVIRFVVCEGWCVSHGCDVNVVIGAGETGRGFIREDAVTACRIHNRRVRSGLVRMGMHLGEEFESAG